MIRQGFESKNSIQTVLETQFFLILNDYYPLTQFTFSAIGSRFPEGQLSVAGLAT